MIQRIRQHHRLRKYVSGIVATLVATCLTLSSHAQTLKYVRDFDIPQLVSSKGLPFVEPDVIPFKTHFGELNTLLATPIADTMAIRRASIDKSKVIVSQKFSVIDSTIRNCPAELTLGIEVGAPMPRLVGPNPEDNDAKLFKNLRANISERSPNKRFVILLKTIEAKAQTGTIWGIQAVSATKLATKANGGAVYFETLLDEIVVRDPDKSYPLIWYFGQIMAHLRGPCSVAFVSRDPVDFTIAEYALSAAKKAGDRKHILLDFVAGLWGSSPGFEPFFADLRPAVNKDKQLVDVFSLRVLAGSVPYGEKFQLDQVIRGALPTRNNKEMFSFAMSFEDKPDLLALLFEFVHLDQSTPGLTNPLLSKEDMIKAYLSTDKGMSYPDRHVVYEAISRYFDIYSDGLKSVPDAIYLRMSYPDGLNYPGVDELETEWKRTVDKYWGIKRIIKP